MQENGNSTYRFLPLKASMVIAGLRTLGMGVADPRNIAYTPRVIYDADFSRSRSQTVSA